MAILKLGLSLSSKWLTAFENNSFEFIILSYFAWICLRSCFSFAIWFWSWIFSSFNCIDEDCRFLFSFSILLLIDFILMFSLFMSHKLDSSCLTFCSNSSILPFSWLFSSFAWFNFSLRLPFSFSICICLVLREISFDSNFLLDVFNSFM